MGTNGAFTFGVPVASGAPYSVTVLSQPDGQISSVTKGSGVVGQQSIGDVSVSCVPQPRYPLSPPATSLGGSLTGSIRSPFTLGLSTETIFTLRNAFIADLDGDGYPEVILGITTYPDQVAQPIIVVGVQPVFSLLTDSMFSGGVPQTQHPNEMFTADLNGDGLPDLVVGNAGLDHPPWTGGPMAGALNVGGGKFRNVSAGLPSSMASTRSYAVAAGDLRGDGKVEIILPDGTSGSASETIHWNGSGFDEDPAWINKQIWAHPGALFDASWLGVADLDGDGYQDVIVAGNATRPNLRVLYGSASGFQLSDLAHLPEGRMGTTPRRFWNLSGNPSSQGANLDRVVIADFNNDGRPDLFALAEDATTYSPGVFSDQAYPDYQGLRQNGGTAYTQIGLQVLLNQGNRVFVDVSADSTSVPSGPEVLRCCLGRRSQQ